MEIDCPPHAIAIWLDGDKWRLRFPDQQSIDIPAGATGRLQSILRARETDHHRKVRTRVGTPGAPIQEIVDSWREADDPGLIAETWNETVKNAGARQRAKEEKRVEMERKARERRIKKDDARRDAEELLKVVGL